MNFHKSKYYKDIIKIVNYVTKMLMHDYSILVKYPIKYLGASSIYLCLKIFE